MPKNSPDSASPDSAGARARRALLRFSLPLAAVFALAVASGCGDDSKPGFCADKSALEESIKALPGSVTSGNIGALKTQAQEVESDARALVDSAKSDFPSETSAITSSIDSVKTAIEGLSDSPSPADLAPIVTGAAAVGNAVNTFSSAADSECE